MSIINTILYKPLYNLLILLAWVVPGHSIGWAIIGLTILIRLALLPASLKASKAQAKMQLLQPKMAEIKEKISDKAEQSKALMELYKEEGVSPLGSCLPILIQLPIIWVLYSVFRHGLDISNLKNMYAFVPHIDSINTSFFGLNIAKPDLWVLPIIAGVSQFLLSYLTFAKMPKPTKTSEAPDMTQMINKQMIYFFPLITIFIGRSMPAALVIYWIITTVFGVAQQLYINKVTHIEKKDLQLVNEIEAEHLAPLSPAQPVPVKEPKKDLLTKIMNGRLEKQAKKSGVTVSVRTKK